MIRVVLDANVLVSAALASDPAAPSVRAFDALLDARIEVVGCPALLGEVAAVLGRDRLRRYVSIDEARRFVADLVGVMTLAEDPPPPYPAVCRDPDDDYLVALARAALVDALMTGDRDLLELEDIGVAVITPRELVERLADHA
ncbi:MAG: putative toxin-antitoxin system toxin component, PIN family [Solirubrobacteraceae bacterium]